MKPYWLSRTIYFFNIVQRIRDAERERIIARLQREGGLFFRGCTDDTGTGYIDPAELRGLLTHD